MEAITLQNDLFNGLGTFGYVAIDEPSTINQIISLLKSELHYSDDEIASRMKLTIEDY